MSRQQAIVAEGKTKVKAAIPSIVLNLVIAALIWLFGALVFVPLSSQFQVLERISVDRIVSAIFLIALLIAFIRVFGQAKNLADGLSDIIAGSIRREDSDGSHVDRYRGALRLLFYIIGAVIAYMFLYPFLTPIAAPLAGIVFILLAVWAIATIFRVGNVLTEIIHYWANQAGKRIDAVGTEDGGQDA